MPETHFAPNFYGIVFVSYRAARLRCGSSRSRSEGRSPGQRADPGHPGGRARPARVRCRGQPWKYEPRKSTALPGSGAMRSSFGSASR